MCILNKFEKCVLNIYDRHFCENPFLFKVVCLIEVSPKRMQEKTTKFVFSIYAVLAVHVEGTLMQI